MPHTLIHTRKQGPTHAREELTRVTARGRQRSGLPPWPHTPVPPGPAPRLDDFKQVVRPDGRRREDPPAVEGVYWSESFDRRP